MYSSGPTLGPRRSTAAWQQPRQGWNSRRRSPGGGRQGQIVKHRGAHETRTIPAELVKLLRAHNRRYGTTPDGRIFQTARAASSGLGLQRRVGRGRKQALTPAQGDPAAGRAPVRNFETRFSVCVLGGVEVAYCPIGWLVRGVSW